MLLQAAIVRGEMKLVVKPTLKYDGWVGNLKIDYVGAPRTTGDAATFARGVEAPVVALRDGALRVADGDLGHEVERSGATELVEPSLRLNCRS